MILLKYDWIITWMLSFGWVIWLKYDWMITVPYHGGGRRK
jgi:hypothetical protein